MVCCTAGFRRLVAPLFVLLASVACGPRVVAQTQATADIARLTPPANSAPLVTTFVDWDSLEARPVAHGETRPVWDNPAPGLDKLKLHSTTLLPDLTTHSPHRHAFEEFCFIREGEIQLSINGKRHRMGPGSLGFYASMDVHGIENVSDKPATYFVCIMPSPAARSMPDIAAEDQNVPGMLQSTVFDCEALPATPTSYGSIANICDSPALTLTRFASQLVTLNAGQTTAGDTPDAESAVVFLKSGVVEVDVNQVTNRLAAGSFFYCPPNEQVAIKNIEATPAEYLTIRFSPR